MLTITIQLDPRDKTDTLDLHLEAIGFKRAAIAPSIAKTMLAEASPIRETLVFNEAGFVGGSEQHKPEPDASYADVKAAMEGADDLAKAVETPARIPGQPSPGHKRRTKVEIQEDEAHFAAQAGGVKPSDEAVTTAASVEQESIFAFPSDADTTAAHVAAVAGVHLADAAQDAADEARETAALKGDKLTLDDLRKAIGAYQRTHGFAAMTKNIPEILGCPVHQVKDEDLADAIRKVEIATAAPTITSAPAVAEHIAENKPVETAPVTVADVKAALQRYARKYDGRDDLGKDTTPITNDDGIKIVRATVGVDSLAQMPKDSETCRKLIAAIDKAVAENPYGRAVKNG